MAEPLATVIPGVKGRVLGVLARTSRPLSGRQVAKRLEGVASPRGVQNALDELVRGGLVDREEHPSASLHTLNRRHLAARAIEQLADLRTVLLERLRENVAAWEVPAERVVLFGSAARGSGNETADIDLLVVRPDVVAVDDQTWRNQLYQLSIAVEEWTGNRADIIEHTPAEFAALGQDDHVAAGVAADGIVLTRTDAQLQ